MIFDEKALTTSIQKYLENYCSEYVKCGTKALHSHAQEYIAKFYLHYSPEKYHRLEILKDDSISKLKFKKYSSFIKISSDDMHYKLHEENISVKSWNGTKNTKKLKWTTSDRHVEEFVVENAWYFGNHGSPALGIVPMNPSPLSLLLKEFYSDEFWNDISNKAEQYANSQKYSCLIF